MSEQPLGRPTRHTETRHHPTGKTCNHFQKYGLTCDEYDELCKRAAGRCELCETPEEETTRGCLIIDHFQDRDVFFVRGLICDKCNSVMARHDRRMAWGPASEPFAERARAYHLRAFQRPDAETFRRADELIAARRPWRGFLLTDRG